MIAFDFTITLGSMIETASIIAGGIYALATLKTTVVSLKNEVDESKRETRESIAGIQNEIKKIGEVLINQADQNRRLIHLEDDVRDLRHGRGFVQGDRGIDREYGGTG
ncbi:MAG TPA: hypothetical protein VEU47_10985 [Candidatus Cybelea sp.]|nr:hypothetical protein [Candidatus Cybelea sp.]